jgi:hypothetical protein
MVTEPEVVAEGTIVAAIFSCGAAQENNIKGTRNTSKLIFRMTHINVIVQNKYRRLGSNISTPGTQIEQARQGQDSVYTHSV